MVYVLDTNFFIEAHQRSYPFDVATSFWSKVGELAARGAVCSIDKVKNEIYRQDDPLKHWCSGSLANTFFCDTSPHLGHYGTVIGWASSRSDHFTAAALHEFLDADEADAWLVAYALSNPGGLKVVTHETPDPNCKKRVKLPDACQVHGVQICNPIGMLRELGETF
ncbi:DUF4411 family protein [Flaviaesturariibacter amylovorans]|uniref:DUF4411 family protein n=1 Tax=Flaviaesturariibacter amylovorans TaxID=1084520 RepID=UPI0031EA050E